LDRFQLQNSGGKIAWSGETLFATGIPTLTVRLSASDQSSLPLKVKLIKNGAVWHEIKGHTPLSITKRDDTLHRGKSYYRIEAFSKSSQRLISNPIFVEKN
jgi:hypothetical protein